ncbi:MAG: polymer-forming cytoskeletal protein [Gemmatimonadota bacterium]
MPEPLRQPRHAKRGYISRRTFRVAGWLCATALGLVAGPAVAFAGPGSLDPRNHSLDYLRNLLSQSNRPALVTEHGVSIAPERMGLSFRLTGERTIEIALSEGDVLIDEKTVGHYQPGGHLQASWRDLVLEASRHPTAEFLILAHGWEPEGLADNETPVAHRLHTKLTSLSAAARQTPSPQAIPEAPSTGLTISLDNLTDPAALEPIFRRAAQTPPSQLKLTIPGGHARFGNYSIGSGESFAGHLLLLKGDANVYGVLNGNLATVDGNIVIHPGAVVTGDVLAMGGTVQDAGGEIRGEIRTLAPAERGVAATAAAPPLGAIQILLRNTAGLVGVFFTLAALGFGLVLFGRPNLEVVADTVSHTFGRSFVVGLLAQMLILPTFGMLFVGLLLSVVGVLLIPFAVLAYVLLLLIGVVGGYLAVAHALGENYTRRRLAMGNSVVSPNSYRYMLVGLVAMLGFWAAWVLFGWVPVAGTMMKVAAFVVTWFMATVGFGATLLSRAGIRESFTGRLVPAEALTDEYLWATPQFGVPAAKRPPTRGTIKDQ